MIKLSKTQKSQLLAVVIVTLGIMGALWYFVVTAEQEELAKSQKNTASMLDKLKYAQSKMRQAEDIANKFEAHRQLLDKREAMLAPDRDAYAWMISMMNPFIQAHKGINIYRYSQPELSDNGLLPGFPYRWATFRLEGTGFYHDLGKFFSDLENNFPSFRVQNLELTPASGPGAEAEKLTAIFELVVPVKTSDTK